MGLSLKKILVLVCFMSFAGIVFGVPEKDIAKITSAMPGKPAVKPEMPRKMLVFSLCKGFRHRSIPHWEKALSIMAEKTGAFKVDHSVDMSVFTAENLKQYDAICFNNTTKLVPNDAQRKAIMDFITGGKGIVGIHAATDNFNKWPEGKEMMGGVFTGHPWGGGGTWAVKIDDPTHPLTKMFQGKGFKINDEIYRTDPPLYSRNNQRVLLSLDMSDDNTKNRSQKPEDADTGITWIKSVGKGRLFYCSLGHNNHLTWNKPVLEHYLAGIQFAMGDLKADTTPVPLCRESSSGPDIRGYISGIKGYEFGQSRVPLISIENIIRAVKNNPAELSVLEESMIDLLNGDATLAAKQFVCQKLGLIGTGNSASALGKLLKKDPIIAAAAAMALERIGGSRSEGVLLDNLESAEGEVKIGIINALGNLKSEKAIGAIGALAMSSNKKVAFASIAALNNIASNKSGVKLKELLEKADPSYKAAVQTAMLECIGKVPAGNWKPDAYKSIYENAGTSPIKAAAFKGLVWSLGDRAGETVVAGLKSSDPMIVEAAVSVIPDIKDKKVVAGIFGCFDKLDAGAKFKLLSKGQQMGTPAVAKIAFESVSSDDQRIRLAAIKALEKVGGVRAVSILTDKVINASGNEKEIARESLYRLSGPGVDEEVVSLAKKNKQTELIQAIGHRKISGAVDLLAKLTASPDNNVATEAFRSLALAGTGVDIDLAVDLLVNLKNDSLRTEAEKCLAGIIVSNDVNINPIIAAIGSTKNTSSQVSLISALGKTGSDKAFKVLSDILTNTEKSENARETSITALADSTNGEVVTYLMKAYQNLSNKNLKTLTYKAIVKTIPHNGGRNTGVKIDLFKKALALTSDKDQRKLVLSEVSKIHNPEALGFVMSYVEDPELKEEAAKAAISIAYRLSGDRRKDFRNTAKQAMEKVMKVSSDEQIKKNAKRVCDRIKD